MEFFGKDTFGNDVYRYFIENENIKVGVLSYGGTLQSLQVKNSRGEFCDVVLGCDNMDDYIRGVCYFGALVGRHAGRIKGGKYILNGEVVNVVKSQGENQLHGGTFAFDKKIWSVTQSESTISCSLLSPHGDQGFKGNLQVEVCYSISGSALEISYFATSDEDTVFNMTNHAYFNLNGESSGGMEDAFLQINAEKFAPIDGESLPTGELRKVSGTPFDFRTEKKILQDIDADDEQISLGKGYDHPFLVDGESGKIRDCGFARSEKSGISMSVKTDAPAVVLYTSNWVSNQNGKNGGVYNEREAFCLETQYLPDSINIEGFESPILKAFEDFKTTTIFEFKTESHI